MLSVSSGLILAIVRIIGGYSNILRNFCNKKNQEDATKERKTILLDEIKEPSDDNNDNKNPENKKETIDKRISIKGFIDIERKILENVKKFI